MPVLWQVLLILVFLGYSAGYLAMVARWSARAAGAPVPVVSRGLRMAAALAGALPVAGLVLWLIY